jgi:hypothetical protein
MQEMIPDGFGKLHNGDLSRYIGDFSKGKAHGRGIFYWSDGCIYDGEFKYNKIETS